MTPNDSGVRRQVRFTPRSDDMVAAQRRYSLSRLRSRATLLSLVFSLLVVAAIVSVFMRDAPWSGIVFVFGCAVLGGVLMPLAMIRWYVPVVARRVYRQQRSLHLETVVDWDETELRSSTERGNGRFAWADCLRWQEDSDILLLYHAENLFQFIPKRALSPAQVEDLRSIAA